MVYYLYFLGQCTAHLGCQSFFMSALLKKGPIVTVIFSLILIGLQIICSSSLASEVTIHPSTINRVNIDLKKMGLRVEGHVKKYAVTLNVDPSRELTGKNWFHVDLFPTVIFSATSIKFVGGHNYEFTGPLTIKGHTRTITAPVILVTHNQAMIVDGTCVFSGSEFGIGDGSTMELPFTADNIELHFHLLAQSPSSLSTALRKSVAD